MMKRAKTHCSIYTCSRVLGKVKCSREAYRLGVLMGFRTYLASRISIALLILFVVLTLNFLIFRVFSTGNPIYMVLDPNWDPVTRQRIMDLWGLNEPLFPNQFVLYLKNLLTWNYGRQFDQSRSLIAPEMAWRLRNTLILLGTSTIGVILVGIPLGILAGSRRGSKTDLSITSMGLFTWGFPTFFVQLVWLFIFSATWNSIFGAPLFPRSGLVSLPPPEGLLATIKDVTWHAISPICTLIIAGFGSWALYTRNMMIDTLTEDYIQTARAKGVKGRDLLFRHAFRSILPPVATMIALALPGIVTGAIITETIFGWPGIGSWYINALVNRNHPISQAVLFNYAVLMIGANLITDLLYGFLDPRIRVGKGKQ